MKKNGLLLIGFCLLAIVLFPSFQEEEVFVPENRIRKAVNQKLNQFRDIETKRCLQRMLDRAGAIADSTLMAASRMRGGDTLVRPPIPGRPNRPDILFPKESTPLAPLQMSGDKSGSGI